MSNGKARTAQTSFLYFPDSSLRVLVKLPGVIGFTGLVNNTGVIMAVRAVYASTNYHKSANWETTDLFPIPKADLETIEPIPSQRTRKY